MSQTQATECVGKPEINARRFWGFKALKNLLYKGYTPALSEIEPDTDCSSKPRIFVLWGEKIVFVADIKSGLVSDVPDTNSRMCGLPSQKHFRFLRSKALKRLLSGGGSTFDFLRITFLHSNGSKALLGETYTDYTPERMRSPV